MICCVVMLRCEKILFGWIVSKVECWMVGKFLFSVVKMVVVSISVEYLFV